MKRNDFSRSRPDETLTSIGWSGDNTFFSNELCIEQARMTYGIANAHNIHEKHELSFKSLRGSPLTTKTMTGTGGFQCVCAPLDRTITEMGSQLCVGSWCAIQLLEGREHRVE